MQNNLLFSAYLSNIIVSLFFLEIKHAAAFSKNKCIHNYFFQQAHAKRRGEQAIPLPSGAVIQFSGGIQPSRRIRQASARISLLPPPWAKSGRPPPFPP